MPIKLDPGTTAAMLVTIGDTDADGKVGVKIRIFADIPLDGTSEPRQIIEIPEWEPIDPKEIPGMLTKLLTWAAPVLGGVLGFLRGVK